MISFIIQGLFTSDTPKLVRSLKSLNFDSEIIYSYNCDLNLIQQNNLLSMKVKLCKYKYQEPLIRKFNDNKSGEHINNVLNGFYYGLKKVHKNSNVIIKLRSDLVFTNKKSFKKKLDLFLKSGEKFFAVDITSRDPNPYPIYHLCDWIVGEKIGKICRLKFIRSVDEYKLGNYWKLKGNLITNPDLRMQFAVEQIIWMTLLNPRYPPTDIMNFSKKSYDEFIYKLKDIFLVNLSTLGIKSIKYPNANLPQFGRLRSAKFNYLRNKSFNSLILMILDFFNILFFEILRLIKNLFIYLKFL